MAEPASQSTGLLERWLGAMSRDEFRHQVLHQTAIARPSTVHQPEALLDWQILDEVLASEIRPDVLVVAAGKLLPLPPPRSVAELRGYLRMGVGACVRHAERCHPTLRAIADAFVAELGEAQVQLFVTPGGTHGFGWHYDDEDVFIAHTLGVKDYYFRANTVAADEPARGSVFGRYRDETSALCAATLVAGDFLYVPARWWHMAVCQQTSLSISVGVTPRSEPATQPEDQAECEPRGY